MTRMHAAVALRRARARRDRWARTLKPDTIRLLLIAEAPPSALDRYFYFPDVPTQDSLFREVARAVLSAEPTRDDKRVLLGRLKAAGVFLIDAIQEPVGDRYRIDIGRLIARVRRLRPERVIVVKVGVFDRIFDALSGAGIPIVPVRVPFPGSGQQTNFHLAFKQALRYRLPAATRRPAVDPRGAAVR